MGGEIEETGREKSGMRDRGDMEREEWKER